MNRVECANCGEIVEVTGSSVVFPYVCSACLGDDTDYADEEGDNIPCDDATTYYIIEARSKSSKRFDDWFRSQNPGTEGVFDDYSTALEAAEREQDGSSIEYRVVEYRHELTPCDAPYNSGVPCQESNLDTLAKLMRNPSILETLNARGQTVDYEELNAFIRANHNSDILDQFDEDTKLIDDLRLQLEQANLNVQILEETIEDLENQLTDLRLDMCSVVFRTHF